jgi:hypothetical protein
MTGLIYSFIHKLFSSAVPTAEVRETLCVVNWKVLVIILASSSWNC